MAKRYVAIWFRHLIANWLERRNPALKEVPFVVKASERGRMVVKAVNKHALRMGIHVGMVVADCKAIFPDLQVYDAIEREELKLLEAIAEWCIRYTPIAAIHAPDTVILDSSGCAHLWGGEEQYLANIVAKLSSIGYDIMLGAADTVGAAWAISRHTKSSHIVPSGKQFEALLPLPASALRLDAITLQKLKKLGLYNINSFIGMPRRELKRRFGQLLLTRIAQALGQEMEMISPIMPLEPYIERLPCLEPIQTATGIEIALKTLIDLLVFRLNKEGKGIRNCVFTCYRIDGKVQCIDIGTTRATCNTIHIYKLFELKTSLIEPGLGIELFTIHATKVEDLSAIQEAIWHNRNHNDTAVAELLDKIGGKVGASTIKRYVPDEHYWPERSYKMASAILENTTVNWREDAPRPLHLLPTPEPIEVTVPIPDYPPMLFKYKEQLHKVNKADGPERIEQEWWIETGLYRDYYCVEDESGKRYWLFRLGQYNQGEPKWFMHGFFA